MDPLLAQLKVEESRKAALTHELATLVDLARVASLETKRIQEALVREAARMRDLLGRHVPGVRRLLRTLVANRLTFTPFEENGKRGYRFEGEATYGGLLAGICCPLVMVSPTGHVEWFVAEVVQTLSPAA